MADDETRLTSEAPSGVAPALSLSFEDFFEVEHDRLLGAIYLVCGNRHEAEELMQDAFLRVWERWDVVQSFENPTGYLYRVAMNQFRMRYRRAKLAARTSLTGRGRVDDFEEVEVREDVRQALSRIAPRQRAALVLTDVLEYSSSEASRALGVKESTVRSLASYARSVLRRSMEDERE